MKFSKVGIKNPFLVRVSFQNDKSKYYHFHKVTTITPMIASNRGTQSRGCLREVICPSTLKMAWETRKIPRVMSIFRSNQIMLWPRIRKQAVKKIRCLKRSVNTLHPSQEAPCEPMTCPREWWNQKLLDEWSSIIKEEIRQPRVHKGRCLVFVMVKRSEESQTKSFCWSQRQGFSILTFPWYWLTLAAIC